MLEFAMKSAKVMTNEDMLDYDDFQFANKWLPGHHPDEIRKLGHTVTADHDTTFTMIKAFCELNGVNDKANYFFLVFIHLLLGNPGPQYQICNQFNHIYFHTQKATKAHQSNII